MPAITQCLFMSTLNAFKIYDLNVSLTGGGPYRSSEAFTMNIYNTAFMSRQMGLGAAKSLLFIIMIIRHYGSTGTSHQKKGGTDVKSKRMHISDKIINILLILLAMLFLIPFYFVIVNSFKSMNEITADNVALPTSLNLDNFKQALSSIRYGQSLLNTFLITFFSNVGWILIAPMGAYYIGRIDNKFCKFLFTLIIASMSIPFQAVMIPMVVVGTMFHLINNIPGVIIIYVGLAIPFAVFMCTGALRYIPREIEESAYIDGATQFQTFWKIVFQ